jgi:hypothetical protein
MMMMFSVVSILQNIGFAGAAASADTFAITASVGNCWRSPRSGGATVAIVLMVAADVG